ncbi:24734_t:CDS:2, partial [Gigaspora margarita]
HIAQYAYRSLANIENELPREWMIANHKAQINIEMEHKVKITTIKMPLFTKIDQDKHSNIDNPKIVCEVVSSIGKVPNLVEKEILNPQQLAINLRILGDSRNIDKKQVANYNQKWTISKKMDQLKQNLNIYNGHRFLSLFNMILLDHWIPDELHVMLRITNRLWVLVLHEIEENGFYNDIAQEIIIYEMKKINVHFEFWQESQTWNYTSLMGEDKLKVLRCFDFSKILPLSRAKIIRKLWDEIYDLYKAMCNPITDSNKFKESTKNWLKLFLTPSTGTSNNLVQ